MDFDRLKATEFRLFLLYSGPIVLLAVKAKGLEGLAHLIYHFIQLS